VGAKRILIVDGDADSRSVYRIMLQHRGHEVDEARDGAEALRRLAGTEYDVVIMELTLQELDGHVLLERLCGSYAGLEVIVLTARSLPDDRDRAMRAGCARYLTKPLQPQELVREVERPEA
jgi:CheY-like chemotaxis protein